MKTHNRFTHWFQKPFTILGLLLILIGITFPGWFGGFISGSIFNTQYEEIKPDYRFFWSNDNGQRYIYTLNVPIKGTTKRSFSVYPNDCISSITINGKDYKELTGDLCNYREGVKLDVKDYLVQGVNTFTFAIDQTGNSRALILKPSIDDPIRLITLVLLGGGLALLLFQAFRGWFIFSSIQKRYLFRMIVGVMYLLGRIYIRRSEYFQRSHDLTGHLDYFKLLLRGERIPKSDDCRQCYHPTTYYWINEVVYRIGGRIGRADPFELIRWMTSITRWIGIMFGFKTLYELIYIRHNSQGAFFLASTLFAFWPTHFYYGPRITNDVGQYMFAFMSIYYGIKARFAHLDNNHKNIHRYTIRGVVASLTGLLIKSNSIVRMPLVVVGLVAELQYGWSKRRTTYKKTILGGGIITILLFGLMLGLSRYKGIHGIVDNADRLNPGNSVQYVPVYEAFTSFYVSDFIKNTTMRDSEDDHERRTFRGFLSKTMITGEMGVIHGKNLVFYNYYMAISLAMIIGFIIRFLITKHHDWFMMLGFIIPIIAMMCYRVIYPLAASMHYRYILPHLVFIVRYSTQWLIDKKNNQSSWLLIDWIQYIILILFIICSLTFSLPSYF
ncbi:MAG TPA: hypothetical protein PK048_00660 [Candidatus Absconditabacterales bacterium]|nr:hypothetical protein [Candidatus Absconditabacterales bacterium]